MQAARCNPSLCRPAHDVVASCKHKLQVKVQAVAAPAGRCRQHSIDVVARALLDGRACVLQDCHQLLHGCLWRALVLERCHKVGRPVVVGGHAGARHA